MRYYDISSRVRAYNVLRPQAVVHNAARTYHNGTGATATTMAVDRTGFYSYMLHVSVATPLDAQNHTIALSAQLESCATSTNGATWSSGHNDVTSLLVDGTGAKDTYYKQLFVNTIQAAHGTVTTELSTVGGAWYDQCADVDDATYGCVVTNDYSGTNAVMVDAMIMGSLRNDRVLRYISPNISVQDNEGTNDYTYVSAVLILGGGDQMPVFEAGTAGTDNYYSKGQ
jgi:hypothetical protein